MFRTIQAVLLLCVSSCVCLKAQQLVDRSPEYRLQRSDVVEIKYRYTPEFDQTVSIGPDGRVSIANFGTLYAKDLTLKEFENKVVALASAHLVQPDVLVVLKEFEKPHVFVEGEVNLPGRIELRSDTSALDAIALAGGFKSSSKSSSVLLLHHVDGQHSETRVLDLKSLVSKHKLEEATLLQPGDVIYVPQNRLSKAERLAHLGQFGAIYSPVR